MSTPPSPHPYRIRPDANIVFREIPTITLRYTAQDGDSDDGLRAPFTWSPLDEYRGAGSSTIQSIRSLAAAGGAGTPLGESPYAADRARSVLLEAREAIHRILGVNHPIADELNRLIRTL